MIKVNYRVGYSGPSSINQETMRFFIDTFDALQCGFNPEINNKINELIESKKALGIEWLDSYDVSRLRLRMNVASVDYDDLSEEIFDCAGKIAGAPKISHRPFRRIRLRTTNSHGNWLGLDLDFHSNEITLDAEPGENNDIIRSYHQVQDKIVDAQPGIAKRAWLSIYPLPSIIASFWLLATFSVSQQTTTIDKTKEKLGELIKLPDVHGRMNDVMLLMAQIESGQSDVIVIKHGMSPKMWIMATLVCICATLLYFKPRMTVELGFRRIEYRRREWYEGLVLFAVPTFIVTTFIAPWATDAVVQYWNH